MSKNILVSNPTLDERSDEETLHRWINDPEEKVGANTKQAHVRQISGMSDLASIQAISIEKRAALRNIKPEQSHEALLQDRQQSHAVLLDEGMRLDRPYKADADNTVPNMINFGQVRKQGDRSSNSRSSYVPSMTPIFNEYDEDDKPVDSRRQSPTPSSQWQSVSSNDYQDQFLRDFPAEMRRNLEA